MADIALDFGLLIAYFIPGVITIIGLAFVFRDVAALVSTLRSGEASTGLFVTIAAFAVVIGMLVSVLRADTIDATFCRKAPWCDAPHCQSLKRIDPDYDHLTEEGKLDAYREAKESEKRPYQSYGNTLVAILLLLAGWWVSSVRRGTRTISRTTIVAALALGSILLLYPASRKSYYRYNRAVEALNKSGDAKDKENERVKGP